MNSEQELWRAFQDGDEDAYTSLYHRHVRAMYRYGLSLVSVSEAFVLDCIHDVFTEIWIRRTRLSIPDNVRHYLLKALKIRILHLLNRKEKSYTGFSESEFDDLWPEPSAEDILILGEESRSRTERLGRLVDLLPHRQQEAIRLRFVENLDYGEIGEMLSVNRQSARNLVFRALEKLRGWL
ncbi:sigma-70 family RNA polymerase sigma factor [Dyadobacter sp. 676]|uniref:Sigma-70 family RNA polymerase sigma factor n=1 Tax=Dyadobacter sp. 676 TaxID=3088362 RepID=A0AAU8FJM9_9BACT